MAKRNLRKWEEAKQRRAKQLAPPSGRWSRGPDGTGVAIFIEDPLYGIPVVAPVWLPMTGGDRPLFPKSAGPLLSAILQGPDQPGVHAFRYPPAEYDEDGEPIPPRIQPTLTVERVSRENEPGNGLGVDPRLWDHGIDRGLRP